MAHCSIASVRIRDHVLTFLVACLLLISSVDSFSVIPSRRTTTHFKHSLRRPSVNNHQGRRFYSSSTDDNVQISEKFKERNKHWIIIVDDEEAIRLAVGDYLYDQGYQVTACADAEAFWQVVTDETLKIPDAIISDIRMPGKNGLELTQRIREQERLQRIPIILLTAKGLTQDRIAGYKAGADVYLPKPFHAEELLSILDNAISRRKQMKGPNGSLVDLKQEMANIKQLMKSNGSKVVKKTKVYLTPKEREVLELLCKGYTNSEIAQERGVNLKGVVQTIQKLYVETDTKTRTELVRWALETGYVSARQ